MEDSLQELENIFAQFLSKRIRESTHGPLWIGDVSDVRESWLPVRIAEKLGYQSEKNQFTKVSLETASGILAYALKNVLASNQYHFDERLARQIRADFSRLGPSMQFWSNSPHDELSSQPQHSWGGWNGITTADFDTGIIGSDGNVGFIFWVADNV